MFKKCSMMDLASVLAIVAALTSWLDPHDHGSLANSSIVNAVHWVLVFVLVGARTAVGDHIKTDVEVTWLLYGFLLGEVDLDSAAAVTLMALSAFAYQRHRRELRKESMSVQEEEPVHVVDAL